MNKLIKRDDSTGSLNRNIPPTEWYPRRNEDENDETDENYRYLLSYSFDSELNDVKSFTSIYACRDGKKYSVRQFGTVG